MKFSSISLIAAALAAIASSATAAPMPRPFERDVDIYSRTTQDVEHSTREKIHKEAFITCLQACHAARKMGDCVDGHWHDAWENLQHVEGHKKASQGGPAYPLLTTNDAKATQEKALKTIARAKEQHSLTAEAHYHAAYNCWDASHWAKEAHRAKEAPQWPDIAAHYDTEQDRHREHMHDHTFSQHYGNFEESTHNYHTAQDAKYTAVDTLHTTIKAKEWIKKSQLPPPIKRRITI